MKPEKRVLNGVWEIYPENVGKEIAPVNILSFEKIIASYLPLGNFINMY